jgi:hypothetical protein
LIVTQRKLTITFISPKSRKERSACMGSMHRTGPAVWFLFAERGSVPARPVIGLTLVGTTRTMRFAPLTSDDIAALDNDREFATSVLDARFPGTHLTGTPSDVELLQRLVEGVPYTERKGGHYWLFISSDPLSVHPLSVPQTAQLRRANHSLKRGSS